MPKQPFVHNRVVMPHVCSTATLAVTHMRKDLLKRQAAEEMHFQVRTLTCTLACTLLTVLHLCRLPPRWSSFERTSMGSPLGPPRHNTGPRTVARCCSRHSWTTQQARYSRVVHAGNLSRCHGLHACPDTPSPHPSHTGPAHADDAALR